jgi:hypothetical protein
METVILDISTMSEEFVSPGRLDNPFGEADGKAEFRRHYAPAPKSPELETPQNRKYVQSQDQPGRPASETRDVDVYQSSFYISKVSQKALRDAVTAQAISEAEVPVVLQIAKVIGSCFDRSTPTVSDVEIALDFRSLERVRQIASGEVQCAVVRLDPTNRELLPRKKLLEMWRKVAGVVEKELNPVEAKPDAPAEQVSDSSAQE